MGSMFYITVLQHNKITHFHSIDTDQVMEPFLMYTNGKNGDINILIDEQCAVFYEEGTGDQIMTVILTGPLTTTMIEEIKRMSNAI
jgi:hypothetical protein